MWPLGCPFPRAACAGSRRRSEISWLGGALTSCKYMHGHVYIHIRMYAYRYVYKGIYIYVQIICTYICIHIHVHTRMCIYACVYKTLLVSWFVCLLACWHECCYFVCFFICICICAKMFFRHTHIGLVQGCSKGLLRFIVPPPIVYKMPTDCLCFSSIISFRRSRVDPKPESSAEPPYHPGPTLRSH